MSRRDLAAFAAGLLFVLGLGVSGMTDPNKVLAFLDVTRFDPALLAVMGAAVGVGFVGFRLAGKRARPVFDERFHLPQPTRIDARLVAGSVLFGVGWGLSGYCPGPALASVVTGGRGALVFVAAMFVGMGLHGWARARLEARRTPASADAADALTPAE